MGKGLSTDLRVRVYGEIERGETRRAAARRFGVSAATGVCLAQRMAATGSLEPSRQGRPPGGGKLAAHGDDLVRWVEAQEDITMPELARVLLEAYGVTADPSNLSKLLCAAGFTYKKSASGIGTRTR